MLKMCQIKISVVSKTKEIMTENYFSDHIISHPRSDTIYMTIQVISKESVFIMIQDPSDISSNAIRNFRKFIIIFFPIDTIVIREARQLNRVNITWGFCNMRHSN